MNNVLYVVVPCYNEETVLPETTKKLKEKLSLLIKNKKISKKSKILYIDDGSADNTWNLIVEYSKKEFVTGIRLSRNRGHQNALLAGLLTAKEYADIVISMDADLQDDIDVIDKMIEEYNNGNEVVYGVRNDRKKDTFLKRKTAETFYKFLKFLGGDIIYNHADFRLSSKKVLNELENFGEVNLFLRGIFPLIGYKNTKVYYERKKRLAGKSKYSIKKLLGLALDGVTSFSVSPIRLVFSIGLIMFLISLIIMLYSLIVKVLGHAVSGWTFIICSIWLIAGIQMLSIGIIGEYIGKIYKETKRRPRYIISEDLTKTK